MPHSPTIHTLGEFRYVDEGDGGDRPPVLLLHGMLGNIDNWLDATHALCEAGYRTLIPFLPVYDMPLRDTSVQALVSYVQRFTEAVGIGRSVVAGNSLGGHVALMYALEHPHRVEALILSGSSGIYELEMGSSMPRRRDRGFIRERAERTFFDPVHVTDQLVEEMYDLLGDRQQLARLIKMARSAKSETLTDRLSSITHPTLLVWGRDDQITPPEVAHLFQAQMPHAELHFIDKCGHAPMVEHPEEFNQIVLNFINELAVLKRTHVTD